MIQFCGSHSAFLMTRWKHQDSPVRPGSVRSPLASSITIALSVFQRQGQEGEVLLVRQAYFFLVFQALVKAGFQLGFFLSQGQGAPLPKGRGLLRHRAGGSFAEGQVAPSPKGRRLLRSFGASNYFSSRPPQGLRRGASSVSSSSTSAGF